MQSIRDATFFILLLERKPGQRHGNSENIDGSRSFQPQMVWMCAAGGIVVLFLFLQVLPYPPGVSPAIVFIDLAMDATRDLQTLNVRFEAGREVISKTCFLGFIKPEPFAEIRKGILRNPDLNHTCPTALLT